SNYRLAHRRMALAKSGKGKEDVISLFRATNASEPGVIGASHADIRRGPSGRRPFRPAARAAAVRQRARADDDVLLPVARPQSRPQIAEEPAPERKHRTPL